MCLNYDSHPHYVNWPHNTNINTGASIHCWKRLPSMVHLFNWLTSYTLIMVQYLARGYVDMKAAGGWDRSMDDRAAPKPPPTLWRERATQRARRGDKERQAARAKGRINCWCHREKWLCHKLSALEERLLESAAFSHLLWFVRVGKTPGADTSIILI